MLPPIAPPIAYIIAPNNIIDNNKKSNPPIIPLRIKNTIPIINEARTLVNVP
jgi:hypothetical protein